MSSKCPNCGKTVYFAEEVRAIGLSWHARCLKCAQCNVTLDFGKINDRGGKVYCKSCYASVAGLKGFGHGVASESSVSGGATHKVTYSNAPIEHESALQKGYSDGYSVAGSGSVTTNISPVPQPNLDPALLPVPRIHQQQQQSSSVSTQSTTSSSTPSSTSSSVSTSTTGGSASIGNLVYVRPQYAKKLGLQ
eukprot:TRINITY_DN5822_c0_g1_i1.p2 TRINITY_DN5822_c0_g1~~TRINITY_DN5822_c0_g1_i1.p2  ORF type:complete len:192 (+),score=48.84 TRINITY_DN5822_c0_g1_i1:870-1445(+)